MKKKLKNKIKQHYTVHSPIKLIKREWIMLTESEF